MTLTRNPSRDPFDDPFATFTDWAGDAGAALDAAIARGATDADVGCTAVAKDVFDRLEAKYKALAHTAG